MDYKYQPKSSTGRYSGIMFVVVLHIVLLWALLSGAARKAVEIIKKPLEAVVIQEVTLPPPPPPPPKTIEPPKPQVAKPQAPPPPFVPPAEAAPSPTAPVIAATSTLPPAPVAIEPLPAPRPAPAKADIGVACPVQAKPEIPPKALQDGLFGVVRAEASIRDGMVKEIRILSGPRVFHAAVRAAMQQYKCTAPDGTIAMQEFEFKVE